MGPTWPTHTLLIRRGRRCRTLTHDEGLLSSVSLIDGSSDGKGEEHFQAAGSNRPFAMQSQDDLSQHEYGDYDEGSSYWSTDEISVSPAKERQAYEVSKA
jgi:hypothetical protein